MTLVDTDDVRPPMVDDERPRSAARLAEGVELLGEYRDSGYQTPKYLVRRGDGQVMQLPQLLYRVAASLDGRDVERIAATLTAELGQELSAEQVSFLVHDRLRPAGLLAPDDDDPSEEPVVPVHSDPLLALRYRVGVLSAGVSWRVAGIFRVCFLRPVWVLALLSFVAVDLVIVLEGDLIDRLIAGVTSLIRHPELNLAIIGVILLSGVFHEFGHVTACRFGGARPGEMGIGLYLVWPALYSTVTDSYRLGRIGRLRTDLGGVYFNVISMVAVAGLYLSTGETWLLVALLAMHTETAWQFLPTIRFDGYYMLADVAGVPELFGYVGPVLKSVLPGRPADPRVLELRPWSRRLIVLWVACTVPVLLFYVVVILLVLPQAIPLVWEALLEYLATVQTSIREGSVAILALSVFQLLMMLLPWLGSALLTVMVTRLLRRVAVERWGWNWLASHRWGAIRHVAGPIVRRTVLIALAGALVWRVGTVAGTAPVGDAEGRLVAGATSVLEGRDAAPSVWVTDVLARDQLAGYAYLTGASGSDGVAEAARDLAVLACLVVVVCFVALGVIRGWRTSALALPLIGVALTGPAVQALAVFGPVVLGAAWAALGGTIVLAARHRHGRHRRRRVLSLRGVAATLGWLAVVLGVASAPVLLLPLAVAGVLLLAGLQPGPLSSGAVRGLAVGVGLLAGLAGAVVPWVLRVPAPVVVGDAGFEVLAALATVLVLGGLLVRTVRPLALLAASVTVLALAPAPGGGAVLPLLVCATAGLAALVVQAWTSVPVDQRPHPLLRAALALPVLVLVCVGALYGTAAAPEVQATAGHVVGGELTGPADGS